MVPQRYPGDTTAGVLTIPTMARNDTDTDAESNYEQITLDDLRELQDGDRVRVTYEPAQGEATQDFEATVYDVETDTVDGFHFDTITLKRDGDDITRRRLYNRADDLDVEGRRTTPDGAVWARLNRNGLDVVTVEVLVEPAERHTVSEAHKAAVREMLNEKVEDFKVQTGDGDQSDDEDDEDDRAYFVSRPLDEDEDGYRDLTRDEADFSTGDEVIVRYGAGEHIAVVTATSPYYGPGEHDYVYKVHFPAGESPNASGWTTLFPSDLLRLVDEPDNHTAVLTYENTVEGADGHTKTDVVEVPGHVIADFPDDEVVYFEGIEFTGAFLVYDDGTVDYSSAAVGAEYEVGVNGTVEDFSGYEPADEDDEDDGDDDDDVLPDGVDADDEAHDARLESKHAAEAEDRDPDVETDGGVAVDGGASGCPHGSDYCEGVHAPAERPELCFDCWREWSAYDLDDYRLDDEDEDARDDEGKPPADHSEAVDPREADDYGVPTCGMPTCNNPAPADAQSARRGFCDEHAERAEVFGGVFK